jgi:DNA-binding beta-propeller fold protein YncE
MWPTAIALDKAGNVYVADEWYHRISIFTKDGAWIGKWGTPGAGDGQLNRPSGMAFAPDDNLYVVDSLNNRVQKFTKEGKFIAKWGTAGSVPVSLACPRGLMLTAKVRCL